MTNEKISELVRRFEKSRPKNLMKHLDETSAGIGCVLKYLDEAGRAVSAGEISEASKVSTARIAVILQKMQKKDLIIKLSDPKDARKTMISLSENGKNEVKRRKEEFTACFSHIVECIGEERFEEFITISEEISEIVNSGDISRFFS